MEFAFKFIVRLFITMIISLILTPIIKLISFKIGAVDRPGERRINTKTMPTAGGLSIFLSFSFALLWEFREMIPFNYVWPMLLGAAIVVVTGLLDDIFELSITKGLWVNASGFRNLFCGGDQDQYCVDSLYRCIRFRVVRPANDNFMDIGNHKCCQFD